MLTFGEALELMKKGKHVTRACWPPELKMFVRLRMGSQYTENALPYFQMESSGMRRVWFPDIDDQLSEDWQPYVKSKLILPKGA